MLFVFAIIKRVVAIFDVIPSALDDIRGKPAVLSNQEIAAMTVPNLREALKVRGLDQSGLKPALVARLQDYRI